MVNYRVASRGQIGESIIQTKANQTYKQVVELGHQVQGEKASSFQREYLQGLARDYIYLDHQPQTGKDKLVRLQKLKASLDSLQVDKDFKFNMANQEISLSNFVKLLEDEMATFEEKKEEKLKAEKEKIKNLDMAEVENIVSQVQGEFTLGDIEKYRHSQAQTGKLKELPSQVIDQIHDHFSRQGIEAGKDHEQIAQRLLAKGLELSESLCSNIDLLLKAKNQEISQERIEELARNYNSVQKISLSEWNRTYPLGAKEVEALVEDLNSLEPDYLQKIGPSFKTIDQALDQYYNYKQAGEPEIRNQDTSKDQASFQYIRYKMTLEKALALNSRGIAIDKVELESLKKELIRLEFSEAELNRQALISGLSTDDLLAQRAEIDQSLIQIHLSDYKILNYFQPNFSLRHMGQIASLSPAQAVLDSYQALATKVRPDLGDSMNKAFQSLSSLLLANGIEVNQANLRAVEILGRGQAEITADNIEKIKEIDQKLQLVLQGLSPERVMQVWTRGQDILSMSLDQLAQYADASQLKDIGKISSRLAEKISDLDKKNQIDQEERDHLILLYRLLHTIEKAEGGSAALLMKAKRPITLENLYDMARYIQKSPGLDQRVEISTGFLQKTDVMDLKTQIRTGFLERKREIQDIFQGLEQDLFRSSSQEVKARLEALKQYSLRDWQDLHQAWQDPNIQDAEIYKAYQKSPFLFSDSFRRLEKLGQKDDQIKNKLEAIRVLLKRIENQDSYDQVRQMLKDLENQLIAGGSQAEKEILAAVVQTKKQWDYGQKLRQSHNFIQVPVWSGQVLHQVNIYYPQSKKSQVRAREEIRVFLAFETSRQGKISALLKLGPQVGEIMFPFKENQAWLDQNKDRIKDIFAKNGLALTSLSTGEVMDLSPYQAAKRGAWETKGRELLKAKTGLVPPDLSMEEVEHRMIGLAKDLALLVY